jgi:hypothetical protein
VSVVSQWLHDWVERHIVARDPYDHEDQVPLASKKRSRGEAIMLLALFALSAITSITGVVLLWRIIAG